MEIKDVFYLLGCLIGTIMGIIALIMIFKEIKKIKINNNDGDIKATVVEWRIFYTGDIRPVLSYIVDGEEKNTNIIFTTIQKNIP